MATFAYSGRTRQGQSVSGERIADSIEVAVAALRREQILVTNITPVAEKAKAEKEKKTRAKKVAAKRCVQGLPVDEDLIVPIGRYV